MSKLTIFPTDTVYGIGCDLFDTGNIRRIYDIKQRPNDKPLACLCADLDQIRQIAILSEKEEQLIRKWMPGPLTLIVKSQPSVKKKIGYETIGVRIPDCRKALKLLRKRGPMLVTSVNDSGQPPINDILTLKEKYQNLVDEIIEADEPFSALSSTVAAVHDGKPKVLREGEITLSQLLQNF